MSLNNTNLLSKMLAALAKIGYTNGTTLPEVIVPRGINNTELYKQMHKAACEYIRADCLRSRINKEHEAIKQRCIELGIFGDNSLKVGVPKLTYDTQQITCVVKLKNPASRLDVTQLRIALLKKMKQPEVEKIIQAAMVENAPAKDISIALK
jgi:hypothetical protein